MQLHLRRPGLWDFSMLDGLASPPSMSHVPPQTSWRNPCHLDWTQRHFCLKATVTAMPKNTSKGGKIRHRGKNENASEESWYSKIWIGICSNNRNVGKWTISSVLTALRGYVTSERKWEKKVWINISDIILVGLGDYLDNEADAILKHSVDEARRLKA